MRKTDRVFTREERKAAIWALIMALVIVAMGTMIQQWSSPSLGPWGGSTDGGLAIPGVLDARPIVEIETTTATIG